MWSGALTTGNKQDIERVQKNAFLVQPLPIMGTAFYKLVKTQLKSEGTNSALILLRTEMKSFAPGSPKVYALGMSAAILRKSPEQNAIETLPYHT